MKVTNRFKLPESFVRAAEDDYKLIGDISVTGLINPIRQTILTRRHWDEISEDASDRVWSLLGKAAHVVLERAAQASASDIAEKRLGMWVHKDGTITPLDEAQAATYSIIPHDGVIITGKGDLLEADGTVTDWKVTSVWTHIFQSRLQDWTAQLSMYAYLYSLHGHKASKGRIIEILRDWNKNKAQDSSYPSQAVQEITLSLWSPGETKQYLLKRCAEFLDAMQLPDDALPECSEEERWTRPTRYAVYRKRSHVRAYRVVDSEEEAARIQAGLVDAGFNPKIEVRYGEDVRCENYCPVVQFCSQAKGVDNGPQED